MLATSSSLMDHSPNKNNEQQAFLRENPYLKWALQAVPPTLAANLPLAEQGVEVQNMLNGLQNMQNGNDLLRVILQQQQSVQQLNQFQQRSFQQQQQQLLQQVAQQQGAQQRAQLQAQTERQQQQQLQQQQLLLAQHLNQAQQAQLQGSGQQFIKQLAQSPMPSFQRAMQTEERKEGSSWIPKNRNLSKADALKARMSKDVYYQTRQLILEQEMQFMQQLWELHKIMHTQEHLCKLFEHPEHIKYVEHLRELNKTKKEKALNSQIFQLYRSMSSLPKTVLQNLNQQPQGEVERQVLKNVQNVEVYKPTAVLASTQNNSPLDNIISTMNNFANSKECITKAGSSQTQLANMSQQIPLALNQLQVQGSVPMNSFPIGNLLSSSLALLTSPQNLGLLGNSQSNYQLNNLARQPQQMFSQPIGQLRPQMDFRAMLAGKLDVKNAQINNGMQQQPPISKWWLNSNILSQSGNSSCGVQSVNKSRKNWTDVLSDPGAIRDKIIKVESNKSATLGFGGKMKWCQDVSRMMEQGDRKRQKLDSVSEVQTWMSHLQSKNQQS